MLVPELSDVQELFADTVAHSGPVTTVQVANMIAAARGVEREPAPQVSVLTVEKILDQMVEEATLMTMTATQWRATGLAGILDAAEKAGPVSGDTKFYSRPNDMGIWTERHLADAARRRRGQAEFAALHALRDRHSDEYAQLVIEQEKVLGDREG